jgi:hypothetical protein
LQFIACANRECIKTRATITQHINNATLPKAAVAITAASVEYWRFYSLRNQTECLLLICCMPYIFKAGYDL